MSARVRVSTGDQVMPVRPVISGRIVAGAKVLTKKAQAVPGMKQCYADGIEAGATFDEIEMSCKGIQGAPAYPLTPRNMPFFVVQQGHWSIPGAAQLIMDTYATKRGNDKHPRLYDLPILFGSNDMDEVFPEQFQHWKKSKIVHWSQDGRCMTKDELKPDQNRNRRWGGLGDKDIGPCEPNNCEFFHGGDCNHVAHLYFRIPVVNGVGLVDLRFNSVLSSGAIYDCLTAVKNAIGHIAGLHNGKPIFFLSKRETEVSKLDWKTGQRTRVKQYLITLEAPGVNFMEYLLDAQKHSDDPRLEGPEDAPRIEAPDPEPVKAEDPAPSVKATGEVIDTETGEVYTQEPEQEPEPEHREDPAPSVKATGEVIDTETGEVYTQEPEQEHREDPAPDHDYEDMAESPEPQAESPEPQAESPEPQAESPEPQAEEKPKSAPMTPAVRSLRRSLQAEFKRLDWGKGDQSEWISSLHDDPGKATRDITDLKDMVAKLKALASPTGGQEPAGKDEAPF